MSAATTKTVFAKNVHQLGALLAVRRAWEALRAEMRTHDTDDDGVYICLICSDLAEKYAAAIRTLGNVARPV